MNAKVVKFSNKARQNRSLYEIINHLMQERRVNVNQLSKNTNLSNTTIKRICTDPDCNPTIGSIKALAEFFGVKQSQLLGDEPLDDGHSSYFPDATQWSKVPVLTPADIPQWLQDETVSASDTPVQYIRTDVSVSEKSFALVANDESLEPKFSAGTLLIFDPEVHPKNKSYITILQNQNTIPQIRQLLIDGPDLYIKAINPSFAENAAFMVDIENCRILATLVQARANFLP